ncbi:MAG: hypothetical protein IJ852_04575 [Alphaproteobacteria bacterium]|nr:hypothetical protein [Alphaproteobacteria bacterium]
MSPQFYGELNRAQVGSIIYARYDGGDLKVFTVVGQSAVVSRAYPSVIYSGDMYYNGGYYGGGYYDRPRGKASRTAAKVAAGAAGVAVVAGVLSAILK